jgi:hypothetical protein
VKNQIDTSDFTLDTRNGEKKKKPISLLKNANKTITNNNKRAEDNIATTT